MSTPIDQAEANRQAALRLYESSQAESRSKEEQLGEDLHSQNAASHRDNVGYRGGNHQQNAGQGGSLPGNFFLCCFFIHFRPHLKFAV